MTTDIGKLEDLSVETGLVWTDGTGFPFWCNSLFIQARHCITPDNAKDHYWGIDKQTPFHFLDMPAEWLIKRAPDINEMIGNLAAFESFVKFQGGKVKQSEAYSRGVGILADIQGAREYWQKQRECVLNFVEAEGVDPLTDSRKGKFIWSYAICYTSEQGRDDIFRSYENKNIVHQVVLNKNRLKNLLGFPEGFFQNPFFSSGDYYCRPSFFAGFDSEWEQINPRFRKSAMELRSIERGLPHCVINGGSKLGWNVVLDVYPADLVIEYLDKKKTGVAPKINLDEIKKDAGVNFSDIHLFCPYVDDRKSDIELFRMRN